MTIGSVHIDRPLILAPMEDVTDRPFRRMCKRFGADIMYTEFVNSDGLVRKNDRTFKKMLFSEDERPFGIQLYGGDEGAMEGAARMADSLRPDLIDINAGCWVKQVAGRGAGAGLLKDLPRMERIVSNVVRATDLPVTVKTRLGWDESSIRIVEVAKMLEGIGVKALTVHCRTRSQGHSGTPDYTWIPKVKEAVRIPVIVNGSLTDPVQIREVFDETGCDGVMIGRAAIDNPWIFSDVKHYFATGETAKERPLAERLDVCLDLLKSSAEFKGERRGVIEMRKFYIGYLRGVPNASKLRNHLMQFLEVKPIEEILLSVRAKGFIDPALYGHAPEMPAPDTTALACS
ncbi:MAG: tRNA dihydrouridine synthase DusB [Bacteroidetes bacterium]|nr:MAG: tRNA dihydrouridine synthase DusB [Bacteroidota bacterium]